MKIISIPLDPSPAAPAPIPVPKESLKPPAEARPHLEAAQTHLLSEMRSLQEKFEQARARLSDQLLQNTRQVAKLSEEVTTLREAIAEFKAIKTVEPPIPPPTVAVPVSGGIQFPNLKSITDMTASKNEKLEPSPDLRFPEIKWPGQISLAETPVPPNVDLLPLEETSERKVAFLTKLWDYLNHVAIEIPLRKKNPSN